MAKKRVYELAKDFGVDSKTVLDKLKDMGEFVKSASSTVEAPVARKLKNAFQKGEAKPGASAAERKTPAPAPSEHRAPAVKPAPVAKPRHRVRRNRALRRLLHMCRHRIAARRRVTIATNPAATCVTLDRTVKAARTVPHPRSVTIRTRLQGSAAPSPARVPTNPVTAATPAAVRRIPEEAPIRVSRARASSRVQAARLPPTAAPVRRLRGLVPATTRSAASRACTPRLRVIFRVRIR